MEHESLWVQESNPYRAELSRLASSEQALYDDLRHNRFGERVRLEQERISYGWLVSTVGTLLIPIVNASDQ